MTAVETLAVVVICASSCFATKVPFPLEYAALDLALDATGREAPKCLAALAILQRVALGQLDDSTIQLEINAGLRPGHIQGQSYGHPSVRAYALRKIGKTNLPEAMAFLSSLSRNDFEWDSTGMVWSAAEIATHESQLIRISGESAQIRFLEDTTREKTAAASWAVEELCERGSFGSLGFIRQNIRRNYSLREDVKHREEFCEAQMNIVSRDPDRIRALGSFLRVSTGVTDQELIGWVINVLRTMRSSRAETELERYANEIDALPENSGLKRKLWAKRLQIRDEPPRRRN